MISAEIKNLVKIMQNFSFVVLQLLATKTSLILLDGLQITTSDLARIEPDNVASFSIMKDATATSLYGARGANGVILVTTKEGKKGKAQISVRYESSFAAPSKINDF